MSDPFADAQAWYDRAQERIADYQRLAYAEHNQIWTLHSNRREDGSFIYSLRCNRNFLVQLKIVACEVANALFQSLDNIVGVAARQAGVERKRRTSWPWAIEKDPDSHLEGSMRPEIGEELKKLQKKGVPEAWLSLIEETFAAPAVGLPHVDVIKEVSLSGKHWELVATEANAVGISWTPKGLLHQVHVDIPANYFEANEEFVFHDGEELGAPHFETLTSTKLVAAGRAFQPEPIAAFGYTSRYVANALEKARSLWKEITI